MLFIRIIITRLRLMLTPSFICALLIFPLALFAVGAVWSNGNNAKIRVGVVHTAEYAKVIEDFGNYIKNDAELIVYDSPQKLMDDVSVWKLECGYVMDAQNQITLYKSPQSMTSDVMSVMLAASLMRIESGAIGYESVKSLLPGKSKEEVQAGIRRITEEYMDKGQRMQTIYDIDSKQSTQTAVSDSLSGPFNGLTALFALLIALTFAMTLASEKNKGIYKSLKAGGISLYKYFIYNGMAIFMVISLFMLICMAAFAGFAPFGMVQMLMCISYAAAVSGFAVFLAAVLPSGSAFPTIITLSFVFTALLGSVVINIQEIAASLAPTRYLFMTTYFMDGLKAPQFNAAILIGIAAGFVGISMITISQTDRRAG